MFKFSITTSYRHCHISFSFHCFPFLGFFLLFLFLGSQAPQHCLGSWNYGNETRVQALFMINRWAMRCQSPGPGEEGQMHSNNATQTCTHSQRERTHTQTQIPPPPPSFAAFRWFEVQKIGPSPTTTLRHILSAVLWFQRHTKSRLASLIHKTNFSLFAWDKQTNHRHDRRHCGGCGSNESTHTEAVPVTHSLSLLLQKHNNSRTGNRTWFFLTLRTLIYIIGSAEQDRTVFKATSSSIHLSGFLSNAWLLSDYPSKCISFFFFFSIWLIGKQIHLW